MCFIRREGVEFPIIYYTFGNNHKRFGNYSGFITQFKTMKRGKPIV